MKKTFWKKVGILCILCCGILCTFGLAQDATAEDTLIRFHVIANSDSAEDQRVKLMVRDGILQEYRNEMVTLNYKETERFLKEHQEEMKAIAESILIKEGFPYGATVEIGKDTYPTKSYGDLTLSAGEYQGVKVVLGNGEGKNWWCVLFPPLCFVDITQNIGIAEYQQKSPSQEEEILPTEGTVTETQVKLKVLEWLK